MCNETVCIIEQYWWPWQCSFYSYIRTATAWISSTTPAPLPYVIIIDRIITSIAALRTCSSYHVNAVKFLESLIHQGDNSENPTGNVKILPLTAAGVQHEMRIDRLQLSISVVVAERIRRRHLGIFEVESSISSSQIRLLASDCIRFSSFTDQWHCDKPFTLE